MTPKEHREMAHVQDILNLARSKKHLLKEAARLAREEYAYYVKLPGTTGLLQVLNADSMQDVADAIGGWVNFVEAPIHEMEMDFQDLPDEDGRYVVAQIINARNPHPVKESDDQSADARVRWSESSVVVGRRETGEGAPSRVGEASGQSEPGRERVEAQAMVGAVSEARADEGPPSYGLDHRRVHQ